jgi:hypothetical protein
VKGFRQRLTRPADAAGLQYRYPQRLAENVSELARAIGQGTSGPTEAQLARLAELRTDLNQVSTDFGAMQRKVADEVNGALAGRPHIVVGEIK